MDLNEIAEQMEQIPDNATVLIWFGDKLQKSQELHLDAPTIKAIFADWKRRGEALEKILALRKFVMTDGQEANAFEDAEMIARTAFKPADIPTKPEVGERIHISAGGEDGS